MANKSPKQLALKGCSGWGGKRKGAGRPNRSGLVSHAKREKVDFRKPLNLTMRLRDGLPHIRRNQVKKLFSACCERVKRFDFHIIHFSIQANHIHVIAEASDNQSLGRGMQSLASSFAKKLKARIRTWEDRPKRLDGGIFAGRYHLRMITNPTQMKNTLRYVLLNQSKHTGLIEHMDPFSSARVFPHWRKLLGKAYRLIIKMEDRAAPLDPLKLGLSQPRSWLAREGWMRAAG